MPLSLMNMISVLSSWSVSSEHIQHHSDALIHSVGSFVIFRDLARESRRCPAEMEGLVPLAGSKRLRCDTWIVPIRESFCRTMRIAIAELQIPRLASAGFNELLGALRHRLHVSIRALVIEVPAETLDRIHMHLADYTSSIAGILQQRRAAA